MVTMSGMEFEERVTGLEMDVQSIKILIGAVDNKVERARLDIQQAQGANVRLFQAVRDDMTDFRASVDARFAEMNARFDFADDRFTAMEDRFVGVENRLDGIDRRLNGMDARFDKVDARFDKVDARLDKVDARLDEVITLIKDRMPR